MKLSEQIKEFGEDYIRTAQNLDLEIRKTAMWKIFILNLIDSGDLNSKQILDSLARLENEIVKLPSVNNGAEPFVQDALREFLIHARDMAEAAGE